MYMGMRGTEYGREGCRFQFDVKFCGIIFTIDFFIVLVVQRSSGESGQEILPSLQVIKFEARL